MKKSILIIIAAMMSAACEEYIDLRREGPVKMLVVNGNLVAGDTLHTLFLSWGMYDDVKPVESAHLDCYVNGKLVVSTDKVTEPDRFSYYANAIRFKAPFNAGDEVRITVNAGDVHAEVSGVAPNAPVVNAVDTSSFMAKNKGGELADFYMAKVHLQDVAGERNFYRMVMSYESEYRASEVPSGSPYKEGQFLCRASKDIVFDNKYESLLYRNLKIGMEDNSSDVNNYYANEYNLFTDNTFADKEYTLKLAVEKTLLHNYYPNSWSRDEYVPAEYGKICFRVLSMSRSTYTYMNDYAFDNSEQGSWTFIDEIPYPSNVGGGTGMVSLMTPADFYVDLKKR